VNGLRVVRLRAHFLGLFWNENRQNSNDQKYGNMKQEKKNDYSKNGLKTACSFYSSGSLGEFKLATDALLFWSAILLLPSD